MATNVHDARAREAGSVIRHGELYIGRRLWQDRGRPEVKLRDKELVDRFMEGQRSSWSNLGSL